MYNRQLNCQVLIRDDVSVAELNNWTKRARWKCLCLKGLSDHYYISQKTFSMFVAFDKGGYTSIEISRTRFSNDYQKVPYYKRAKIIARINECLFNAIKKEYQL